MAVKLQTIKDIRNYIAGELAGLYSSMEAASIADTLVSHLFRSDRASLMLKENDLITEKAVVDKAIHCLVRLRKGEPVQYVTGETLFCNCVIKVNPGVLIPRPETEELTDLIIRENRGFNGAITDIGTGSGCIAVALAVNLPRANVTATDISDEALKTAGTNSLINNVDIRFLKTDIFLPGNFLSERTDIIVSNPPYVRNSEKTLMHINVLDFEPHQALFVPDEDPLRFYNAILSLADHILNPQGKIYLEINEAMGQKLHDLLGSFNYHNIEILKDINGKDRFTKARKGI